MTWFPSPGALVVTDTDCPPKEACRIMTGICQAVAHAHRIGVVHRDLHPGNVMVEKGGHVLVLDFGLAKALDVSGVTASGVIVGTPSYLSPGQLQGQEASPRSDLCAVGPIFYFVLTGQRLVHGDNTSAVVAQHLSGLPATRLVSDPAVPGDLKPLLSSIVQKDPEKRPASLDDVLLKLSGPAKAEIPTTALEPIPASSASPAEGSKRTPSSDPVKRQAREKMKGLLDKLSRKDGPG